MLNNKSNLIRFGYLDVQSFEGMTTKHKNNFSGQGGKISFCEGVKEK